MRTVSSKRRSSFGTDCVCCGDELIAPDRSEYRDERHILHLWRCPKCDRSFEIISPADTKLIEHIMRKIEGVMRRRDVSQPRLVA